MDNKGQVLVIFILIIPIVLLVFAYVIDTSHIGYENVKLERINRTVIKDASLEKLTDEQIREYIYKNDSKIIINSIEIKEQQIEITLSKNIKSLFAVLTGKNNYKITSKQVYSIN